MAVVNEFFKVVGSEDDRWNDGNWDKNVLVVRHGGAEV